MVQKEQIKEILLNLEEIDKLRNDIKIFDDAILCFDDKQGVVAVSINISFRKSGEMMVSEKIDLDKRLACEVFNVLKNKYRLDIIEREKFLDNISIVKNK